MLFLTCVLVYEAFNVAFLGGICARDLSRLTNGFPELVIGSIMLAAVTFHIVDRILLVKRFAFEARRHQACRALLEPLAISDLPTTDGVLAFVECIADFNAVASRCALLAPTVTADGIDMQKGQGYLLHEACPYPVTLAKLHFLRSELYELAPAAFRTDDDLQLSLLVRQKSVELRNAMQSFVLDQFVVVPHAQLLRLNGLEAYVEVVLEHTNVSDSAPREHTYEWLALLGVSLDAQRALVAAHAETTGIFRSDSDVVHAIHVVKEDGTFGYPTHVRDTLEIVRANKEFIVVEVSIQPSTRVVVRTCKDFLLRSSRSLPLAQGYSSQLSQNAAKKRCTTYDDVVSAEMVPAHFEAQNHLREHESVPDSLAIAEYADVPASPVMWMQRNRNAPGIPRRNEDDVPTSANQDLYKNMVY